MNNLSLFRTILLSTIIIKWLWHYKKHWLLQKKKQNYLFLHKLNFSELFKYESNFYNVRQILAIKNKIWIIMVLLAHIIQYISVQQKQS
jgi:hypothetical protein